MTTAYFDCFSGISGDMILGAMVDAGAPFEELKVALASLPVKGYDITCRHVQRCGIGGTQVQVHLLEESHDHSHDHGHSHGEDVHSHDHDHKHKHSHSHSHDDEHSLSHDHSHTNEHNDDEHGHNHSHDHDHDQHHHAPHRGFTEIKKIIQDSGFSDTVKNRTIEAFCRIAVEEAAVHETTIEAVHFHEVGAVDAIVDIVGAMWCVERLGITHVLSSPVAVGSGTIRVAHGEMPIPAPATARLLAGVPICTGPVTGELATPTGAAILTTLSQSFGPLDNFLIETVAYGAGTREYPDNTNYLRLLLGNTKVSAPKPADNLPLIRENLTLVTAEIDDMPAELLGAAMEAIMAAGALDCHFVPVQMKKNRPAVSLHVLSDSARLNDLLPIIFQQTTTFGVKLLPCERLSLKRRIETVATPFGDVRIKIALWQDAALRSSPEYEDCRTLAREKGCAVMDVYNAAVAAAGIVNNSEAGQ